MSEAESDWDIRQRIGDVDIEEGKCNCDLCQCYGQGTCQEEGAFANPEEI